MKTPQQYVAKFGDLIPNLEGKLLGRDMGRLANAHRTMNGRKDIKLGTIDSYLGYFRNRKEKDFYYYGNPVRRGYIEDVIGVLYDLKMSQKESLKEWI